MGNARLQGTQAQIALRADIAEVVQFPSVSSADARESLWCIIEWEELLPDPVVALVPAEAFGLPRNSEVVTNRFQIVLKPFETDETIHGWHIVDGVDPLIAWKAHLDSPGVEDLTYKRKISLTQHVAKLGR